MRSTVVAAAVAAVGYATTVSAICHHGTYLLPRAGASGPEWGYNEIEGPLAWHALGEEEYSLCALGKNQSPIDIVTSSIASVDGKSLALTIDPYPHGAEIMNLGSTIQVTANGTMMLNNIPYSLAQFHFHTPSEHRIDSEFYPMEVHFVFQAMNSTLAVVGVPIEVGSTLDRSPVLKNVFKDVDAIVEPHAVAETGPLDFASLQTLISHSIVYQYSGSLTTPPCTEGVAWNVVNEPLYIDYTVFNNIKAIIKFNSRYTQNTPGEVNLLQNAGVTLADHV